MAIPEPFKAIIERNYAAKDVESDWIKRFFDGCFSDIIKERHITNYQARASVTGEMFEHALWYLMTALFHIELDRDYPVPEACMKGGGSLDFAMVNRGRVLCGIEAKGSAERVTDEGGRTVDLPRPALKRTDTMKKAIAQAYQFKRAFPEVPFYIVTNAKPTGGNAKCMMDLAEGDIVDRFVDATDVRELTEFAHVLQTISSRTAPSAGQQP